MKDITKEFAKVMNKFVKGEMKNGRRKKGEEERKK